MVIRVSAPFTEDHYCGEGERPNTGLAHNSLFTSRCPIIEIVRLEYQIENFVIRIIVYQQILMKGYYNLQQPQQQRQYHTCNKRCAQEIYFDANNKSQSGKYIPLDKDTGEPHQCKTIS
jgi:hypothetical protein